MTNIEWCHPPGFKGETWNPITGCAPVSEGCKNCYARRVAEGRLRGRAGYPADEPFRVTFHPDRLSAPLHWPKRRFCFACSMGDLFHEDVWAEHLAYVINVMAHWFENDDPDRQWQHSYVLLTKRPGRAVLALERAAEWSGEYMAGDRAWGIWLDCNDRLLPDNVWLGVSCESQRWADERIPVLLQIPAAVRLVSLEPLLGLVYLRECITSALADGDHEMLDALNGMAWNRRSCVTNPHTARKGGGLDWVIVGGETGPGARLCRVEWIGQVVHDCKAAGVPCFVKALGSNSDHPGATGRGADMSQWPEDIRVREFPDMNQRDASASSAQAPGAEDGA